MRHRVVSSHHDFCGLTSVKTMLPTICLLLASALPACGHAQQYAAYMYKHDHRHVPVTHFSPADTIGMRLTLKDLAKGAYTLHVDWHNASGELQETNRYRFNKQTEATEVFEVQLDIIKASPLRRLFSVSEATGYHMKFYGKWQVVIFLNGERVLDNHFHIQ